MSEQAAAGVRVNVYGHGEATVETGLPVLNRLLARLAETARFDLVLDIEPGGTPGEGRGAAGGARPRARGPAAEGGGTWRRPPRGDLGGGARLRPPGDERRAALRHERRPHAGPHWR